MTWELVTHGGWRSLAVAVLAVGAVVATVVPSLRSRAHLVLRVSCGSGLLLSADMIIAGLYASFATESPAGLAVSMVGAITSGLGPLMISVAGLVLQSIVAVIVGPTTSPETRQHHQ